MRKAALAAAAVLAGCATGRDTERSFERSVSVRAPLADVWRAWSTTDGAEEWLAPKANIRAEIRGPYELLGGPTASTGTVIGVKPLEMISFQWNGAPGRTWVVVKLEQRDRNTIVPKGEETVKVTVRHFGFLEGPAWDRAYDELAKTWDAALGRLARRFERGPILWSSEGR